MPVPDYQTLMLPVLKLVASGHETIPECLQPLTQAFDLTEDEVDQLLPSGKQTVLANRAHWARTYLSQAGLVEPVKRGHYRVTETGRATVNSGIKDINKTYLERFDAFQDFLQRSRTGNSVEPKTKSESPELETTTPEMRIEAAAKEIESALSREVVEAVLSLSPARFERLVVDLLLAMGYGGGDLDRGLQTGLSGDGGIDGIINEDELGLNAVYVQAKRYAVDNKVGRPAPNAFVGSLTGEGATKGVFVTTSDFSRDAMDYVARVQQRTVLINGDRLARLMIKHEVGVRPRKTYVLRSVDEDYFSDS
jgi:restriction system protein